MILWSSMSCDLSWIRFCTVQMWEKGEHPMHEKKGKRQAALANRHMRLLFILLMWFSLSGCKWMLFRVTILISFTNRNRHNTYQSEKHWQIATSNFLICYHGEWWQRIHIYIRIFRHFTEQLQENSEVSAHDSLKRITPCTYIALSKLNAYEHNGRVIGCALVHLSRIKWQRKEENLWRNRSDWVYDWMGAAVWPPHPMQRPSMVHPICHTSEGHFQYGPPSMSTTWTLNDRSRQRGEGK